MYTYKQVRVNSFKLIMLIHFCFMLLHTKVVDVMHTYAHTHIRIYIYIYHNPRDVLSC